jgi:hypothetical protein
VPGATVTVPRVRPPVEKPLPVQEVALAACQASVEDMPGVMVPGAATKLMMGVVMGGVTVTVVEFVNDPPGSVQVSE